MILEVDPEALAELEEQAAFYEERREGLGFQLLAEASGALAQLADRPGIGARDPFAPSARRFLLPSFPFAVVYVVEAETLFVAAFAHTRRKPNYWRARLNKR